MPPEGKGGDLGWPVVRTEARPGAYWWWPGSAVTREDLTWNLETYRRAGWGSLGVVCIYGVRGAEDQFLDIFSPRWFPMFNHAVAEAKRLGMRIDLTPSSGWRLGGPHVQAEHGEMALAVKEGKIVARGVAARVKRAGPGGKGLAINPYSPGAVAMHFQWLGQRFDQGRGSAPRAFYYDSFENPGNWCPEFLPVFQKLRGYRLEEHASALAGKGPADEVRRVVCDYRQTLSDMLIDRVKEIATWADRRGSGLRMQAHGAPANLLDMYAAASIPETEVFGAARFDIPGYRRDPKWVRPDKQSDLVNLFASSAAHVAGRPLVIAESFTWLRNHYHTALSHLKAESDRLLLNGINGIYYHGICYAPKKTAWPGWLFYASTEANARNSIFRDVPVLNAYITRCQSVLQEGRPDQDVLLYWPVFDLWMGPGTRERRFSVHHPEWIDACACGAAARWLLARGYTMDFVSDRQLAATTCKGGRLHTAGNSSYGTVLIPAAEHVPVATVRALLDLARSGATVLLWKHAPRDVPGWWDHAARRARLKALLGTLAFDSAGKAAVGKGRVIVGEDLGALLEAAGVQREPLVDRGLRFIRRRGASCVSYFLANHTANGVDGWLTVSTPSRSVVLLDPMTARVGLPPARHRAGCTDVYLQLHPGETRVLRLFPTKALTGPPWPVVQPAGEPVPVAGPWRVRFVEGGPVLPKPFATRQLGCWAQRGDKEAERFAGAARYDVEVKVPPTKADRWVLDLGDVRESARVWVNGQPAGAVVAHPFRVDVTGLLRPGRNRLAIEVTNLSANRIRDLDRRGVTWRKFHDINFVTHLYKPFDASAWSLKPSGLLGPVRLTPYRVVQPAKDSADP